MTTRAIVHRTATAIVVPQANIAIIVNIIPIFYPVPF